MSTVAQNIVTQLGGSKFVAMTGANNLVSGERGLTFRIGRNTGKVTHVKITLTAMDDYQVEFLAIRGTKVSPLAFKDGLQAEQLRPAFERVTGLRTSLCGRRNRLTELLP